RHPCPHCKKYRGNNGFKRRDHLTQHLRNYHHIDVDEREGHVDSWDGTRIVDTSRCPLAGCPQYREQRLHWQDEPIFPKRRDYTEHMKKVHNESPFPCPEPGCDRIDGRGYFRKVDLIKHQKKEHG
ncbi:hypothetical protein NA57DRAFT_23935, partial [Rhizodiscina lignyota]